MSTSMPASWISAIVRHQQLEQELALLGVQPIGQSLQLLQLLRVCACLAVGVVANQHLREVRIEALDVLAELISVLKIEHVLA
jgi:hypothetical protein